MLLFEVWKINCNAFVIYSLKTLNGLHIFHRISQEKKRDWMIKCKNIVGCIFSLLFIFDLNISWVETRFCFRRLEWVDCLSPIIAFDVAHLPCQNGSRKIHLVFAAAKLSFSYQTLLLKHLLYVNRKFDKVTEVRNRGW